MQIRSQKSFFIFFRETVQLLVETPLMTKRQHSTAQRPTPECAGGRTHKKGRKNDNDALLARLQLNGWMTVTVLRSVGANAGRQDWYSQRDTLLDMYAYSKAGS